MEPEKDVKANADNDSPANDPDPGFPAGAEQQDTDSSPTDVSSKRMPIRRRVAFLLLALVFLVGLSGIWRTFLSPPRQRSVVLLPILHPEIGDSEPAVVTHLTEARDPFGEKRKRDGGMKVGDLASAYGKLGSLSLAYGITKRRWLVFRTAEHTRFGSNASRNPRRNNGPGDS